MAAPEDLGDSLPPGVATCVRAGHPVCADRVVALLAPAGLVLAVADGSSGAPGASEAAEAVIDAVHRTLGATRSAPSPGTLVRLLEVADAALREDPTAGESTAVVVVVTADALVGASVGDSGAWMVDAGGRRELTRDQTRQPRLGTGAARPVGFTARLGRGLLLLATDGLLGTLPAPEIEGAVRDASPSRALRSLEARILGRFGAFPDDLGMVAYRPPGAAAGDSA